MKFDQLSQESQNKVSQFIDEVKNSYNEHKDDPCDCQRYHVTIKDYSAKSVEWKIVRCEDLSQLMVTMFYELKGTIDATVMCIIDMNKPFDESFVELQHINGLLNQCQVSRLYGDS